MILLAAVGILGSLSLAVVNYRVSDRIGDAVATGLSGDTVGRQMLRAIVAEERFMKTDDQQLLATHKEAVSVLRQAAGQVAERARDDRMRELAGELQALEKEHTAIFAQVAENQAAIGRDKAALSQQVKHVQDVLAEMAAIISQKEAMMMMEGEFLDANWVSLRGEIKDYLSAWNEKLLNIQDLLIFGQTAAYEEKEKTLESKLALSRKNLPTMLTVVNDAEQNKIWQSLEAPVATIATLQASVYDRWQKKSCPGGKAGGNGQAGRGSGAADRRHYRR